MSQDIATIRVTRYRPEKDGKPYFQDYTVPYRKDMVVLDALNYIKANLDGTLTYRWSCRMGVCGSCGANVDGIPKLTCASFLHEFKGRTIRVEPYDQFSSCINCMLCYSACPVYGLNEKFLGPAATALAYRYIEDSRDQGKAVRFPIVHEIEGVWECTLVGECSVVCPKGVDPMLA